ncbi:MAG: hypothetical protein HQK63_05280 [Desulfamplus sp.]|nr:hypothetical protein [Desulfamplus sp.]
MSQPNSKSSIKSSIISMTIIGLLIVIAITIFNQQFEFNPAVKIFDSKPVLPSATQQVDLPPAATPTPQVDMTTLQDDLLTKPQVNLSETKLNSDVVDKKLNSIIKLIPPFEPMSVPEFFDNATLSDKINGKAELYLPAGFKSLKCQRFKIDPNLDSDNDFDQNYSNSFEISNAAQSLDSNNTVDLSNISPKTSIDPDLWIEVFIYDMTLSDNAFAVFSRQRRENSTSTSIAQYSYQTENALFFVHGHFYIEIIASSPSSDAAKSMIDLAKAFINDHPNLEPKKMDVPDLFPTEAIDKDSLRLNLDKDSLRLNLDKDSLNLNLEKDSLTIDKNSLILDKESITLITSDAFGFDGFDNIYTASYTLNKISATAFISKRSSIEEAATLAQEYSKFLVNFGGKLIELKDHSIDSKNNPINSKEGLTNSKIERIFYGVEIMDTFEFVFSSGIYLAGVRETESLETANSLANQLYAKIALNSKDSKKIEGKN